MEKKGILIWWGSIKNDDEDSNKRYIIEVDVEYDKDLHNLHSDLPFRENKNLKMQ